MSAGLVVAEVVGEDAQLLDGAARHALEAGAAVDVGDVDRACLCALDAAVGDDGRACARREEDRLEERAAGHLREKDHVVEGVDEVDAEEPRLGAPGAREEVVAAERPRVGEVGLAACELVVDLQVAHVALHRLSAAGELVDESGLGGG